MKEICIYFAEWIGINTFNGSYMMHDINSRGIHIWRLHNEFDFIMSNEVYQKYCINKNVEFTKDENISYWCGEFEPTNFVEYIGVNELYYYRWNYNNEPQEPYWTKTKKIKLTNKITTVELWNEFKNK